MTGSVFALNARGQLFKSGLAAYVFPQILSGLTKLLSVKSFEEIVLKKCIKQNSWLKLNPRLALIVL